HEIVVPPVLLSDRVPTAAADVRVGSEGAQSHASPLESPSAFCCPELNVSGQLSVQSLTPSPSVSEASSTCPLQLSSTPLHVSGPGPWLRTQVRLPDPQVSVPAA